MLRFSLFFTLLIGVRITLLTAQPLTVSHLRCNHFSENPLGIARSPTPRLSWKLQCAERDVHQTAYQIRVATDSFDLKKGRRILWDSGKVSSNQSVLVNYAGPALRARTGYFWQVKIWDTHGHPSPWSKVAWWETGLDGADSWQAKWIAVPWTEDLLTSQPCPIFRTHFFTKTRVMRARLYVTAHGLYEVYLNGEKIGDQWFAPGWTSYHHRLQYQVYDVTNLVQGGKNTLQAMLGDGWWRGNIGFAAKPKQRNFYGSQLALLAQLEITFADGSRQTVTSGPDWVAATGPILQSDIYNGEAHDARLMPRDWQPVRVLDLGKHNLIANEGPPVRGTERLLPVKKLTTLKGETVYDFGQNLVGWVGIKVRGQAGDTVVMHCAEVLDSEGNFYTANLRSARQELRYTLRGDSVSETFRPHFTFMGFRYVRVRGVQPEKIEALVIHSDLAPAGHFECSDSLINRLVENIRWSQRGNFLDVPTDCPQRDERLGWTGDAQVFCRTAAFNYDVAAFFQKWLHDLSADQLPDGRVPHVIPQVLRPRDAAAAGWADAATIVPWQMYQIYGDTAFLREQYPAMKKWVDYLAGEAGDSCLWRTGKHFGDWIFFSVNDDEQGRSAITEKDFIAQVFFVHSLDLVQRSARVLGLPEEAARYTYLFERAKAAFQQEYVTPNGRLISGTQTAYVLALAFDLLPENQRAQAATRLVENIRRYGHLTTGFLGTPLLCPVLTRFGYLDVAYQLLERKTYPSWLYPITRGATTTWERPDGIRPDGSFAPPRANSFNHYANGAVGDWLYRLVAGLDMDEAQPGYRHLLLQPHPGGSLTWARAEYETPYGPARCGWKVETENLEIEIEVPPNATAMVRLPGVVMEQVSENGKPLVVDEGVQAMRQEGRDVVLEVGSGCYRFLYPQQ